MSRWAATTQVSTSLRVALQTVRTEAKEIPCSGVHVSLISSQKSAMSQALTTSLMPIQKANRLLELSHSAPAGFGASMSWN